MVRDHSQLRKLAIVPAYNEQGMVGRVVRDIHRQAPDFDVVVTAITRQRITDPTSGFRITNRRGIELFARDYPHDYPEVEAILMLHAHRLRLHEVPVRMNARGFGKSSIDYPRSAYYMAKVLLALFIGLFRRRPTPLDEPADSDEPEAVAPGAAVSGAGGAQRGG